eukprot:4195302-Amphidinium_carterae.2
MLGAPTIGVTTPNRRWLRSSGNQTCECSALLDPSRSGHALDELTGAYRGAATVARVVSAMLCVACSIKVTQHKFLL